MSFLDTYRLNPEQRSGVLHDQGPLLILAGAGSGKTRVITARIAWLISELGIAPDSILALTFTNKAAREMKARIAALLQEGLRRRLQVGTFHAFGVRFLKRHLPLLGYRQRFSIIDSEDRLQLLTNIMQEMRLDLEMLEPQQVAWTISSAKNRLINAEQAAERLGDATLADIYRVYQRTLRGFSAVDLDDLLLLPVELLRRDQTLATEYSERYRHILVDEYQDTNHAQYSLLRLLTGRHDNLCVVGDDDQSIYAWRGADIGNILSFEHDFPGAKVIRLEQNYRSSGTILRAANSLIANNASRKGKTLWSSREGGEAVRVLATADEKDEALSVLDEINDLRRRNRYRFSDMAVVFRTNFQTRPFEELFTEQGVPYEVVGGTRFYDRKEVKDCIAYLRLLANHADETALLRIINKPKRGVGPRTMEKLAAHADQHRLSLYQALADGDTIAGLDGPVAYRLQQFHELIEEFGGRIFSAPRMAPVVRELLLASGYQDELIRDAGGDAARYQRGLSLLEQVVTSVAIYEEDPDVEDSDLFGYLSRVALLSNEADENEEKKRDAVTLLTLHACKGLEFPVVFIAGVEEGSIPHVRSMEDNPANLEEERRLFYVGMTRAQDRLCLSFAETRRRYGEEVVRIPSPFLEEIDQDCLYWVEGGANQELSDDAFNDSLAAIRERLD